MTNELAQQVPAGWYADPRGPTVCDGPSTRRLQCARTGEPAQPVRVPHGTPVDTVCIRLAVLLPLLTVPLLFMVDVDQQPPEVNAVGGSPFGDLWYNLASLLGWPIYGLMVWFSYSTTRPSDASATLVDSTGAWSFLWPLVYVVGRFVMVRRPGRPWSRVAVGRDRGDGDDLRRLGLAVHAADGGHLQRRDEARAPGRTDSIERMPRRTHVVSAGRLELSARRSECRKNPPRARRRRAT